jgi:hypothetical protein
MWLLTTSRPKLLRYIFSNHMTSFQILLALATLHGYHIHQMDVIIVFLNCVLHKDIYISQPKAFVVPYHKYEV